MMNAFITPLIKNPGAVPTDILTGLYTTVLRVLSDILEAVDEGDVAILAIFDLSSTCIVLTGLDCG